MTPTRPDVPHGLCIRTPQCWLIQAHDLSLYLAFLIEKRQYVPKSFEGDTAAAVLKIINIEIKDMALRLEACFSGTLTKAWPRRADREAPLHPHEQIVLLNTISEKSLYAAAALNTFQHDFLDGPTEAREAIKVAVKAVKAFLVSESAIIGVDYANRSHKIDREYRQLLHIEPRFRARSRSGRYVRAKPAAAVPVSPA